MVVNIFNDKSLEDLINDDAYVFSGLFTQPKCNTSDAEKYGHKSVTNWHYDNFIDEMRTKITETRNISAFGKSKLFYLRLYFTIKFYT